MHARDFMDVSDETLVLNCQKGNKELMGVLYHRHYKNVFFLILSIIKDKENAMDLCQEIFLKVCEHLSSFRGDSKFSTWLYAITRNYCLEFLRKQQRYKFESIEPYSQIPDEESGCEEQALYESKKKLFEKEIDESMERDQNILYQKYIMQLSIKDIQKNLNLSESAVKMRLQRARNKMGRKIQYLPEAV